MKNGRLAFRHLLAILILLLVIGRTYFYPILPENFFVGHLLNLIRGLVLLKLITDIFPLGLPKNETFLGIVVFMGVAFLFTRDLNFLTVFAILLSFREYSFSTLIKSFLYINVFYLAWIFLFSAMGVFPNATIVFEGRSRQLLGFNNPNAAMRASFNIWVGFIYVYWRKFTWNKARKLESLIYLGAAIIFPMITFYLTRSRMAMIAIVGGVLFFLLSKSMLINKRFFRFMLTALPWFLTGISLILGLFFADSQLMINRVFSYRPHLWGVILRQQRYPINFWGYHSAILHHMFDRGTRLVLDSTYLNLLTVNGIGVFLIFMGLLSYLLYDKAKNKDMATLFVLVTILIYGFGENVFFDVGTNPLFFMIYPACEKLNALKWKRG
ncbi:MAG: hypothetical protein FWF59_11075 [Turicibacter sp.]|nr:hypothetical protein [Turicibacter sp.]